MLQSRADIFPAAVDRAGQPLTSAASPLLARPRGPKHGTPSPDRVRPGGIDLVIDGGSNILFGTASLTEARFHGAATLKDFQSF